MTVTVVVIITMTVCDVFMVVIIDSTIEASS